MTGQHLASPKRAPKSAQIKGWQVLTATIALLWIYRTTAKDLEPGSFNWPIWTVWFFLTVVFRIRGQNAGLSVFSASHVLARSAAGAAVLMAISSISILRDGLMSATPLIMLLTSTIGLYIVSGLVTLKRKPQHLTINGKKQSLEHWLDTWLPLGMGTVLVRDLRVISFAFWPGRQPAAQPTACSRAFTNHFEARPVLIALLAIALVELSVVHILLSSLSSWIVIAHLAFGALFVLYLIGIIRSFTSLPTIVEDGLLHVRMSVFFEAITPVSNICAVSRINSMPAQGAELVANGAIFVAPNILIELKNEIEVERMFKPKHLARFIAIYVDEPATFIVSTALRCPKSQHGDLAPS